MGTRRLQTSRARAPRGTLAREQVVRAALDLMSGADSPSLTMKRVADALNTRPMSLYSHVENREDLVHAAADLALREWVVEIPRRAGWERQIRVWCESLRNCIRLYPALVWEIARSGKFHPALLEKTALLSRSLRRTGIDDRARADLLRWIPQTVLGAIVLELSRPTDLQSGGDEASAIYASIGSLTPEDRAEFASVLPHFSDKSLDDLFEFSIDRLIDGIRAIAKETTA